MVDIDVYEPDTLDLLGIVDTARSVIWRRRYSEPGDFEIYAPATPWYISLLQMGRIVAKTDDEPGIIEAIRLEQGEDGEYITASGSMLTGVFSTRGNGQPGDVNATAEAVMRELVAINCISPELSARAIPCLALGTLCGDTTPYSTYVQSGSLAQLLTGIAQYAGLGYRIRMGTARRRLLFEVYRGIDRSVEQAANPRAVFAEEYDTLIGAEYEAASAGEINVVTARSAGMVLTVGREDVSGYARREGIIEVDPVMHDMEDEQGNTWQEVNRAATRRAMQTTAEKLLAAPPPENFAGNVLTATHSLVYRQDYDLGDIVTVRSDRWGLTISPRITQIDEVYDEEGARILPTFGSALPTILNTFKRS